MKQAMLGLTIFLMLIFQDLYSQELVTYPAPQSVIYSQHNDDYTVKVRKPGGLWQDLFEYKVKVDMDNPQDASMVYFDFSGTVEVVVRKNNGDFRTAKIRPAAYKVAAQKQGDILLFTLNQPHKISIEFDGDRLHNLHLFASPIEVSRPDSSDPNVMYFGPGLHVPKDSAGVINIPNDKIVYIAGGAVVRAKLKCDGVKNVRIMGRGILDKPDRGVEITNSNNISVDGIIVVNPKHYTVYSGSSNHITIKNLKSFSAQGWSDGIDMMSCSDVAIDDIFMRNSDDCIAIYGHRWKHYGNARNYTITNATLWADVAHPINIGIHGNTQNEGDTIENIVFKNIHILEHDEDDVNYQGCMAITDGDLNLVRNIHFEDIYVDNFQEGQLLNLSVVYNVKYNTGPGRGVQNISFKNVYYTGANFNPSVIQGLDSIHTVTGVSFENIIVNGKKATNLKDINITAGPYVSGIILK